MDTLAFLADFNEFVQHYRGVIVVLATKEEELGPFLDLASLRRGPDLPGVVLWTVEVEGRPVVLARCASGKINATMAACWLVFNLQARYIMVIGSCGAIDPCLEIGDIVLSWRVLIHDYGIFSPEGFRYRGSVALLLNGQEERFETFQGDQIGCERAKYLLKDMGLMVYQGLLASGDAFLNHLEDKQRLYRNHGVTAVEMTTGGVAATCQTCSVPWLAIRCVSDRADAYAERNYTNYWKISARRSAEAALSLLKIGW